MFPACLTGKGGSPEHHKHELRTTLTDVIFMCIFIQSVG